GGNKIFEPCNPESESLIVYTSGTTGRPKGVVQTNASSFASITATLETFDLTEEDRFLCVLPIHHANSFNKVFATWLAGGMLVLPSRFRVNDFWKWVDAHQCTWLAIVPSIISQLLRFSEPGKHPSVRFARSSSAPLPDAWHKEFEEKFGISMIQGMGSTETGPLFSNPLPPHQPRIGSTGKSVVRQEVKIVDAEGNFLGDYETGNIVARGPSRMKEYYKDNDATTSILTDDGWIQTGDIGYRDSDGYFFVTGRAKEIVIKSGVNIALREIDEALLSHQNVVDAAAAGIEDMKLGEDVVAYVVTAPGKAFDETEFLDYCLRKLGSFKAPSEIIQVSEIPRSSSGKIRRFLLKDKFGPEPRKSNNTEAAKKRRRHLYTAPRTPIEKLMGDIWSEHLKRDTISIHDDFFGLGGYSILAIRMLTPLRKAIGPGISLTTFFDHPSIAEQAELVVQASMMRSGISTHQELRQRLFNTFDEESITDSAQEITLGDIRNLNLESRIKLENDLLVKQQEMVPVDDPIPSRPNSELSPLSFAQQRIWFLEELSPDTTMYNTGDAVRLTGDLDINALEKALIQVVQRHEILRLQIQVVNGEPFQSFRDEPGIQLQRKNFENLAEDQKEQHLNQVILTILRTSYDLKKEPLIRAAVVKMGPEEHIFILGHHHLVTDGWSSRVIFGDIRVLYNNLITGKNTELPALSIQYADFAVWQRNQLTEDRVSSESDYWIQRLRGVPTLLDLPTDLPRPKIQSHRGHRQYFELSNEDFTIVEDFSCRLHVSPFVTLSAAFASILYRYSQQEDFLIGLPFADRDRPELQNLAGLMLDTHLIRFSFSNETTFTELIHRTRSEISETYSHRDLPFELVVDAVQPERSLGHMPLCQVTVTWREFDSRLESLELEGLKTENILPHDKTAKFDISVIFSEKPQGVTFEVEYNTDLFASPTIERMAGHFKRLLMVAVSDPGMPISELSLLKEEEQQNQLKDWNATKVDFGREYCIHELFEKQVGRSPHAVAVEFKHRQLSYEELNRRANRLAHYLADLGLGQEAPVGICMERSFDMMVALLAVLKAGGAYVPLDPFYPNNRLAFMLEDSGAQVILTQSGLRDHLPENQIRTLCLDTERFESYPSDNLTAPSPESLAYILYTSGSTGKPKGVMMEHRALANHMHWMQRQFPLSPADKVLQKTSISFDASVWELFAPLLCGARLVLALPESHRSPTELLQEVKHNRITILQLVPTMLEAMADTMDAQHCSSLRRLYCGGEVLNADLVRHIHEKLPVEIVNLYGPTEACIDATAYVCNSDSPIQK
ncbi:MAG: AMP-binding protein, partial [Verrucomicrobiae bacterium]|nr:AMP-binding protein [Verrucomicrobiae bacterium]